MSIFSYIMLWFWFFLVPIIAGVKNDESLLTTSYVIVTLIFIFDPPFKSKIPDEGEDQQ